MATPRPSPRGRRADKLKFQIDGGDPASFSKAERVESENCDLRRRVHQLSSALESARTARRVVRVSPQACRSGGEHIRVIVPDSHGSAIDRRAAGVFLADLKALDPTEIVLLGDHVDCGGFLAQHHTLGYVAQTDYSYQEDIASANDFLDGLQRAAPRAVIHYIEGNHERRVETWCVTQTLRHERDCEMLRKAFAPEFLLRLRERGIHYYRQSVHYHGLRVPGAIRLGKCYFWHGVSAARHAASVNLAQFAGNVVYGHTHRIQNDSLRPVAQGEMGAWCPGCLCQQQPLWQHTRPTDWTLGYAVQVVARNGDFMHSTIPIIEGRSLLMPLLNK